MMYHVVLDPARETLIELVPEGGITPLSEKRELIEFNDVSRDPVALFHADHPDTIFRIPNRIVRAEIQSKLLNEQRKIPVPSRNGCRVVKIRKTRAGRKDSEKTRAEQCPGGTT